MSRNLAARDRVISYTEGTRLHVVSHTHWDREWYRTAESFRIGLIELIDDVLARDRPFLLDGQAILVDDYLSWKPEATDPLHRRLARGSLEAGPWYVLADNLIPSGEALVRNLLAGRRTLGAAGAKAPPVLYCPDSFGHPAAGPTLAAGFALPLAIVWRGYGGRGWPAGDSARWRSMAGEEVQLFHLSPSGYEEGSNLPVDPGEAALRWPALWRTLHARATLPASLLLNGADHHAMQRDLSAALDAGRAEIGDLIDESTLWGFAEVRQLLGARVALPVVTGELRGSPSFAWSLQGTFGSRAHQKRANAGLERLLVREVEPWTALAWWRTGLDLQCAEHALWRLTLTSHPHDTLCGSAIDEVAHAMDDRIARAAAGAVTLRDRAVAACAGRDGDRDRAAFSGNARAVLITNPVPWSRCGVVEVEVDIPLAIVAVGPGSADQTPEPRAVPPWSIGAPSLPMQRLGGVRGFARHDAPHHYPRTAIVQRERALVWVDDLPPLGTRVIPIVDRRGRARPPRPVRVEGTALDNGRVRVWWDTHRGLCCARGDETWEDLLAFETVGDRGDLYTHSAIPSTLRRAVPRSGKVTLRGPLRGELRLNVVVPVAARQLDDATGVGRSRPEGSHRVVVRVQLDAGAPWFRILVSGANAHEDQRLRAVVRTGARSAVHRADAAFGAVERSSLRTMSLAGDVELLPGTSPLQRAVSVFDVSRGFTVISDGLAEYEASGDGEIAITLVRAVGELSRNDLPERPGHAGWPSPTPLGQCVRDWEAQLAILPHGLATPATLGAIERACDDVLVPARGRTTVPGASGDAVGLTLLGDDLAFGACKRSEDGADLVVRCTNVGGGWAAGSWRLAGLECAWVARLDETPLGALEVRDGIVAFLVAPHATSTIRLRAGRSARDA
ncbi:MAG: hypothetical protein IT361_08180 [Gemmatimonadaceae bacterium]|nr:hypothetical protein [Gemmatimonadaceae bacterium]